MVDELIKYDLVIKKSNSYQSNVGKSLSENFSLATESEISLWIPFTLLPEKFQLSHLRMLNELERPR